MKKKLVKLKLIASLFGIMFVACIIYELFNFGSGLAITDYMEGNDKRNPTPIKASEEKVLIEQLDDGTLDDEFLNNMYFTKENFKTMLEAIDETKDSYSQRASDIYYEYYYESWVKVPKTVADYDSDNNVIGHHIEYVWEWVEGVEESGPIHFEARDLEADKEINPFGLYWQPIYALCQMQSVDIYDDEFQGWKDHQDETTNELIIDQRLDMETVYAAINVFKMQFEYLFDAAAFVRPTTKQVSDLSKVDIDTVVSEVPYYDANGDPIYDVKVAGEYHFKWNRAWDGSYRNGGSNYEEICYLVDTYEENAPDGNCKELHDGSTADSSNRTHKDFWEFQPPEEDNWNGYRRVYKKIPATVLTQSYNGYSSHKWYTAPNTIEFNKYHYKYDEVCKKTGDSTDWTGNNQLKEQQDYIDIEKFYQACKAVCSSFEWEEFILILETLPDSDYLVDFYTEMYDKWKIAEAKREAGDLTGGVSLNRTLTGTDIDSQFKKETVEGEGLTEDGNRINFNTIIGSKLAEIMTKFNSEGFEYLMPSFGDFDEDEAMNATLQGSKNYSYEDLYKVITSYPAIVSKSDSVFLIDPEGCAKALLDIQDDYDVDVIGLFSIACLESGWGTSNICKEKGNFVGWQAYDSSPYASATNFGNTDYAAGLYNCLRLIARNYTWRSKYKGGEDQATYYTMRYSPTGTHNYCTSTTWPHSNSMIRAQLYKFLGRDEFSIEGFTFGTVGEREYVNPLGNTSYRISSTFGPRTAPKKGASTVHNGIDMAANKGAPILAVAEGTVITAGYNSGAGYYVVINHGVWIDNKPTYTRYLHMNAMPEVSVGTIVPKGALIGAVGSTGVSTGPHLHFEVRVGADDKSSAVDPQKVFGGL